MLYFDYFNYSIKQSTNPDTIAAMERIKEAFPNKAIFLTDDEFEAGIFSQFLKLHGIDSEIMMNENGIVDIDMLPIIFEGEYIIIVDMKDLPLFKLVAEKQDAENILRQADITLAFEG